nr:hypothetical protein GCM10020093_068240 [Planobispora longispora]
MTHTSALVPSTPPTTDPTAPADASHPRLARAVRARMPLALDVAIEMAKLNGVCIRPVEMRRLDIVTGQEETFDIPCGATQEAKCLPCAKRNRYLRMAQCREGWHLEAEPVTTPAPATEEQQWLIEFRADVQAKRDHAERVGDVEEVADWDAAIREIDVEINAAGMRGSVLGGRAAPRRSRSTRRRQDAPDLPKRAMSPSTLGRSFTGAGGTVYRPSMFITLTLPSYGSIRSGQGVPVDPSTYDYRRAARDALHFSKLVDRFVQNLRRVAGYDVQYFATVEPQKRLAPHLHMAIRGTLPRAEIKAIAAATYHQVWWPATEEIRFEENTSRCGLPGPTSRTAKATWTAKTATTSTRKPVRSCLPGTKPSTGSTPTRTPAPACTPLRRPGRRPRRTRRHPGRRSVHPLPVEVPDQESRRNARH